MVRKKEYTRREIGEHRLRPESLMMGYGYRPEWSEGAIKCPIFQTSTFAFKTAEEGKAFFELAYGLREQKAGESLGLIYSRLNNPDLEILEDRLSLWDGAERAAVCTSGMAAIATTLFSFLRPGDVLLHSEPVYGGTEHLITNVLPQFGIDVIGFPAGPDGPAAAERALSEESVSDRLGMIFIETPANPTNDLVDIAHCAELAAKYSNGRKVAVAVDNTFLGPLFQHPLKFGADLVIYSATKFIGGHSDLIAGAVVGPDELVSRILETRTFLGTASGPWTGWLLLRSLETLKLRMTSQMKNAQYVADFLADHPKVDRVHYLGHITEDHPQYELYRKQCTAPGSMVAFEIRGGETEAFRFLNALKLIHLAVSLGGTESLAEHPGTMTHSDIPAAEQPRMGITPALIRLSIGVEHYEDIIADIEQALDEA
ncbi:MAG: cystathionine gamma-synthase family protein [Gemmatimonadetes bacterium]|uniref:Cystathionine gamma-synthase family protein n=1 Tax=Candidatus Kutchimonas denitrificans TaxID=3056748 RepID=A0AAE4ZB68_9BACT|nr:cystathionine gamma-synthase family protein [Gemmatimonadota bacterium]NIR74936.1 cystathionine gamma-synthase family protein [Candidatus Kutchimonas denitrificans]NIS00048.1 cystathionine gamma-synthase family protein [Gemmatimonadota bacterium]NIT65631.1 cystathionine gamma-synthase family protein [Gemmatimonadota bacterium]NIU52601.1 cystathionine gamma-synthase family protein [Gemmatimonadota bacterium]